MGIKMSQKKPTVVCDGYVKYWEAEVDRLIIMQNIRDNEKNPIENERQSGHFGFYIFDIWHWLSLSET